MQCEGMKEGSMWLNRKADNYVLCFKAYNCVLNCCIFYLYMFFYYFLQDLVAVCLEYHNGNCISQLGICLHHKFMDN